MQAQEFLAVVRDGAVEALPEPLRDLRSRIRYGMLQLHYSEPTIHYEVWLVRKTGRIEIGLHFEGERDSNHQQASELAERALELRDVLGTEAEIEEWSPSWTRLHLTVPLRPLDSRLAAEVAERLASLVQITGESVQATPHRLPMGAPGVSAGRGRHWRGRSRGTSRTFR
jgi:hypothetical protein